MKSVYRIKDFTSGKIFEIIGIEKYLRAILLKKRQVVECVILRMTWDASLYKRSEVGRGVTQISGRWLMAIIWTGWWGRRRGGLGLTYNNRSCSRVQWLDSTWKLGQLRQGWGMGRRQVSSQQNVSYSTSTRRETWSHVTTDKLTVAYAAQTVSNFGANREFRTSICLGDTAGKLAGTTERISSRWIQPGTRPSFPANTFCAELYRNE